MTCSVCHQPECPESTDGERPLPGAIPARLANGQGQSRGYGEWIVHPLEAVFLLHRGYAVVDGVRQQVEFLFNEAFVTQIKVEGTFPQQRPPDRFVDCAFTGERLIVPVEEAA